VFDRLSVNYWGTGLLQGEIPARLRARLLKLALAVGAQILRRELTSIRTPCSESKGGDETSISRSALRPHGA
jgi:hypothetical protein